MLISRLASTVHPLWLCGFRPFFLLTALSGALLMLIWGAFLSTLMGNGAPLPAVPGGPFVWHAHEMIFGFGLAAATGFALTAIPEFTGTAAVPARPVRWLVSLWLLGRAAFWLSGWLGTPAVAVSALAHLGLLAMLSMQLAPRLQSDAGKRHRSFLWALIALAGSVAGFYADALCGAHPARWLHAALGLLMILIIIAMSRISMSIVNKALDEFTAKNAANAGAGSASQAYRARPPKRNLAIVCIALYTITEFFAPGARVGGWLALAAAAALCHLQSDWHIGRALFRRWPLMLFGVYLLMAAGYGLIGYALLGNGKALPAGRHLLAVGALGLGIYAVLNIAGRIHCGHPLDERPWIPLGAACIAAAALARAATALPDAPAGTLLALAGGLWILPFALYTWRTGSLLMRARDDGATGCEGIISRTP